MGHLTIRGVLPNELAIENHFYSWIFSSKPKVLSPIIF